MRVLILLLLTFGMHASCTRVDEIPVRFIGEQTDVHSLSSFSDKVEHIPLRMRDDFVLGGVSDVRCWDNNWYIFDKRGRNAVFVYDSAGFPLYSYTRRGRAAGEYSRLESFDVSPDFGYVCLVCHENKIIVLDETLNFKREYLTESYTYVRAAWYAGGILLFDYQASAIDFLNLETGDVKRIFEAVKDKYNVFNHEPVFMRAGERLFFHTETDDHIYEISDEFEVEPLIRLEYQDDKKIQRYYRNNVGDNLKLSQRLQYIRPKVNFIVPQHDDEYILGYTYKLERINMYVDKLCCDFPIATFGSMFTEGMIVGVVGARNYTRDIFKQITSDVVVDYAELTDEDKESGNPVLLIHHLKKG